MKLWSLLLLSLTLAFHLSPADEANVETWLAKGDAYDKQLKTREALAAFREAEKLAPEDSRVLLRISKQLCDSVLDTDSATEQKKLAEQAVSYAQRALKIAPNAADAHVCMAFTYGRLSFYSDPRTKVELSKRIKAEALKAIELSPKNDIAHHLLGRWHYELANLSPLLATAAQLVYGELPKASNEQAIAQFKKAIELAPDRALHHIELGRTYAAMGQKELAKAEIEKGLSLPNRDKEDPETKERGRQALSNLKTLATAEVR